MIYSKKAELTTVHHRYIAVNRDARPTHGEPTAVINLEAVLWKLPMPYWTLKSETISEMLW